MALLDLEQRICECLPEHDESSSALHNPQESRPRHNILIQHGHNAYSSVENGVYILTLGLPYTLDPSQVPLVPSLQ